MTLIVVLVLVAVAVAWWLNGRRSMTANERNYLRQRGYTLPQDEASGPALSADTNLLNVIESLNDLTPFSRQRAAEELSRMCEAGRKDTRMFAPLITALDDNSAAVRGAVAKALASLGDERATEALARKAQSDESIHVRAVAQQALDKLAGTMGESRS